MPYFTYSQVLNSKLYTWDLANAKTITPANFVSVMPDRTLLPVIDNASHAR